MLFTDRRWAAQKIMREGIFLIRFIPRLLAPFKILNPNRWKFEWLYYWGLTPWDTQKTPPEVMEFIAHHPPGKALDLGCGTGTNALTLARHGWQVTGVDFSAQAIHKARQKASINNLKVKFYIGDVTDLSFLPDYYDYALDIGCLFTLNKKDRVKYVTNLNRLLRPGGWYMLYAWLPRIWRGKIWGISPIEICSLMNANFIMTRQVIGEEKGHPSAWYWFQRRIS